MSSGRTIAVTACVMGFAGVVLAAVGAHAVPGVENAADHRSWQSASTLHLVHALALLVLGLEIGRRPSRLLHLAAGLFFFGIILFSGSIYARIAFGLDRTFNLAPFGGFLLMLAWLSAAAGLLRR
jgi:uncharacterized membrane protein YgdD (TMEM256/DUF423 family)